jgi:hypothetical protein
MATLILLLFVVKKKKATACSLQPMGAPRQPSGPRVRRPPIQSSATAENFGNTALGFRTKIMYSYIYLICPIRVTSTAHNNLLDPMQSPSIFIFVQIQVTSTIPCVYKMLAYGFHWSCYNEIAMKPKISCFYRVISKVQHKLTQLRNYLIFQNLYTTTYILQHTALHLPTVIPPTLIRVAVMSALYITGSLKSSAMLLLLMAFYTGILEYDKSQLATFCSRTMDREVADTHTHRLNHANTSS